MNEQPQSLAPGIAASETRLSLRILATNDVHANLLPYDYFTDRPVSGHNLARTATMIARARADQRNSLLFDNGDFLQGTPLSDLLAQEQGDGDEIHPVILAMNTLGYDAAGLGNHEFNFGLGWLQSALARAQFPVTCANLLSANGSSIFPPYLLLRRELCDTRGNRHQLTIGVIGLTPPQTTTWDRMHLEGRVESRDMVETARRYGPEMRAAGADLVIALAHTGLSSEPCRPMMENAAAHLGTIPEIDVILAGHAHQVFPPDQYSGLLRAEAPPGMLHQTPMVMAGAHGSHLGVVDLDLVRSATGGWQVRDARPSALRVDAAGPVDATLGKVLRPAHRRTLALIRRQIGHARHPLHSYLALATPCAATALVTRAQAHAVRRLLRGTVDEGLPIVSASAPFRTGGRGGPHHFTDVAPGPLRIHHAADLYPFPNMLSAVRLTGAELADWLERAAILFNRIIPGRAGQFLINPLIPGHNFDMIDGLTYQIDLNHPPRYDLSGRLIHPDAHRITSLRHAGQTVQADQVFVLATNNYRISGGGPFVPVDSDRVIHAGHRPLRTIVAEHIEEAGTVFDLPDRQAWRFCPMPGTEVLFDTGPGVRAYPEALIRAKARDLGDTPDGFVRLAISL